MHVRRNVRFSVPDTCGHKVSVAGTAGRQHGSMFINWSPLANSGASTTEVATVLGKALSSKRVVAARKPTVCHTSCPREVVRTGDKTSAFIEMSVRMSRIARLMGCFSQPATLCRQPRQHRRSSRAETLLETLEANPPTPVLMVLPSDS